MNINCIITSGSFVRFLSSWSSSHDSLWKRIAQLARAIAHAGFWQSKEIEIIDAWLADLHSVGYFFPSIVRSISSSSSSIVSKASSYLCNGVLQNVSKKLGLTLTLIFVSVFIGEIDTFLFLSSSLKEGSVPFHDRMKQVRSYMNSTVTILFEDRFIDPGFPPK